MAATIQWGQPVAAPTPINDEAWTVALVAEIEAIPYALADVTDPYQVGWFDAELGEPSEPTKHYAKLGDIEMYILGHRDATAILEGKQDAKL